MVFHHGDHDAVAEDLWCDPWTLEVRLSTLRPAERDYYSARLSDVILRVP